MRSMAMMGLTQPNGTRSRARVERCLGSEILLRLKLGYELACCTALAQHASVPDYHTSGAWVAVAVAGVAARLRRLDRAQTAHAIGITENHGPQRQMVLCIDHLTMFKDGSG